MLDVSYFSPFLSLPSLFEVKKIVAERVRLKVG